MRVKYVGRVCAIASVLLVSGTSVLAASDQPIPQQIASIKAEILELRDKLGALELSVVKKSDFEELKQTVASQQQQLDAQQKQLNELRGVSRTVSVSLKVVHADYDEIHKREIPFPNTRVLLKKVEGGEIFEAVTDINGVATLDVPVGTYWYGYQLLYDNGKPVTKERYVHQERIIENNLPANSFNYTFYVSRGPNG